MRRIAIFMAIVVLAACSAPAGETTTTEADGSSTTSPEAETTTTGAPESTSTTAASREGTIKIGLGHAVPQVYDAQIYAVVDNLTALGYEVELVFFEQPEQAVQAAVRGDVDFSQSSAPGVFAAISEGIPVTILSASTRPDFVLVATADISDPGALGGVRVGVHATVSTTTLLTRIALQDHSGVEPELLVVPGSQARMQALLAGELDASAIQIGDFARLEAEAPGEFHSIYEYASTFPNLYDNVVYVNSDRLTGDTLLIEDALQAFADASAAINSDPSIAAGHIAANVEGIDAELAADLADRYVEIGVWVEAEDVTVEGFESTIALLSEFALVEDPPTVDECCDLSFVATPS